MSRVKGSRKPVPSSSLGFSTDADTCPVGTRYAVIQAGADEYSRVALRGATSHLNLYVRPPAGYSSPRQLTSPRVTCTFSRVTPKFAVAGCSHNSKFHRARYVGKGWNIDRALRTRRLAQSFYIKTRQEKMNYDP